MLRLMLLGALLISGPAYAQSPSEQFSAGEAAYKANCMLCHGETGRGGQGYANPIWGRGAQIAKFSTAAGLLEYHLMMMPFDDPTRLDDDTKVAITFYILAQHGTMPQSGRLDTATAASVTISAAAAAPATTAPAEAALAPAAPPPPTTAAAPPATDHAGGEAVFRRRCAVCHSTAENSPPMVGTNLRGIVGRRAGTVSGGRYSEAMRTSGLVWDEATLSRYLAAPSQVVPRTTMAFSGIRDPAELALLVSYLRSTSQP